VEKANNYILTPELIKKTELFNSLTPREADFVIAHSCVISLTKESKLFSVGEPARHFYILIDGEVRIIKKNEGGDFDELARYKAGDIIGDFDFARKANYEADAQTSKDSALIMFPAKDYSMEEMTSDEPDIVVRILLNSINMVTGRIKSTQNLFVENLSWVNELHRRAYEDPGTGLYKQTFIKDEINRILEEPMSLIMLKPDRFKILVDARGHEAGDKAMVKIAAVLMSFTRKLKRGWAIRLKSNETCLLINKCQIDEARRLALELSQAVKNIEPVPADGDFPSFSFSGTIAWATWPCDGTIWDTLFQDTYALLLETWKSETAGEKLAHYER